jgi:hypothetical protein
MNGLFFADARMVQRADPHERHAALNIGAAVLAARWPQVQASCTVQIQPNLVHAHAAMVWPGVVRVTAHATGALIAQSLPGQPNTLDSAAFI